MISGLNQEVDILGRVFHFQTELSDQDGLSIRTEVFVGGKVVATRETRLAETSESVDTTTGGEKEAIRARMKEQHNRTLTTFVKRAKRYTARGAEMTPTEETGPPLPPEVRPQGSETAPAPPPSSSPAPSATDTAPIPFIPPSGLTPPSTESRAEAAEALAIRRFFGELQHRIGPLKPLPGDLVERLERAREALAWMTESPVFAQIRVDEQVRGNLVLDQIGEWLADERDTDNAAELWEELNTFVRYLAEVNQRSDLLRFDQQLLLWALDTVQYHGMSTAVLDHLRDLYGRHPKLDQLLEYPDNVKDGTWAAHLRSILTLL